MQKFKFSNKRLKKTLLSRSCAKIGIFWEKDALQPWQILGTESQKTKKLLKLEKQVDCFSSQNWRKAKGPKDLII